MGHRPQAVVRVEVAVGVAQAAQVLVEQREVQRLLARRPAASRGSRRAACREAPGRVQCQVDRVELDVRDRVDQRRSTFGRERRARRHLQRRDEAGRSGRPGGSVSGARRAAASSSAASAAPYSSRAARALACGSAIRSTCSARVRSSIRRIIPFGESHGRLPPRRTHAGISAPASGSPTARRSSAASRWRRRQRLVQRRPARRQRAPHHRRRSNIQDGSVLHADAGMPLVLGRNVTVGHQVMLHGCTVGDNALIGIGAVVLNGARIGANCLVGAGALVTEGKQFPDGILIVGSPRPRRARAHAAADPGPGDERRPLRPERAAVCRGTRPH